MDSKIKVAEFISRLEFGGAEAMLLNYTTHFQHPEQFDLHIITQDINDETASVNLKMQAIPFIL